MPTVCDGTLVEVCHSVPVAMMDVGMVRMRVRDWLVLVPVAMRLARVYALRVLVPVVLVVHVAVAVGQPLVVVRA